MQKVRKKTRSYQKKNTEQTVTKKKDTKNNIDKAKPQRHKQKDTSKTRDIAKQAQKSNIKENV